MIVAQPKNNVPRLIIISLTSYGQGINNPFILSSCISPFDILYRPEVAKLQEYPAAVPVKGDINPVKASNPRTSVPNSPTVIPPTSTSVFPVSFNFCPTSCQSMGGLLASHFHPPVKKFQKPPGAYLYTSVPVEIACI